MKTLSTLIISALILVNGFSQTTGYASNSMQPIANESSPSPAPSGGTGDMNRFEIGVRFVPNITSIGVETLPNWTVKSSVTINYSYGIFLGYNFTENMGILLEGLYSPVAYHYSENNNDRIINVNYLNIPLLFKLNSGVSDPVNFNLVVGPQLGISTGSSISTTNAAVSDSIRGVLATKAINFGIAYGVGVDFALNSSHSLKASVGYRGVFGLMDISDRSKAIQPDQYYILDHNHVNSYGLYAGLSFLF